MLERGMGESIMASVEIYLTQRDLEKRWKLSGRTLERWRMVGAGPAWVSLCGTIRYRLDDVENFETRNRNGGA